VISGKAFSGASATVVGNPPPGTPGPPPVERESINAPFPEETATSPERPIADEKRFAKKLPAAIAAGPHSEFQRVWCYCDCESADLRLRSAPREWDMATSLAIERQTAARFAVYVCNLDDEPCSG
jgi:hypothetical protein